MIKNFTKLSILCLIAAISFTACKKSSNNKPTTTGTYTMKSTINDTLVTFSSCLAADITANGVAQINIIGSNKTGNQGITLDLIASLSTLKAGTTFQPATDYEQPNTANVFYTDKNGNDFITAISEPSSSVTITSVSATTITGTFTMAKLYAFSDLSGTTLRNTITSGTFTAQQPSN